MTSRARDARLMKSQLEEARSARNIKPTSTASYKHDRGTLKRVKPASGIRDKTRGTRRHARDRDKRRGSPGKSRRPKRTQQTKVSTVQAKREFSSTVFVPGKHTKCWICTANGKNLVQVCSCPGAKAWVHVECLDALCEERGQRSCPTCRMQYHPFEREPSLLRVCQVLYTRKRRSILSAVLCPLVTITTLVLIGVNSYIRFYKGREFRDMNNMEKGVTLGAVCSMLFTALYYLDFPIISTLRIQLYLLRHRRKVKKQRQEREKFQMTKP